MWWYEDIVENEKCSKFEAMIIKFFLQKHHNLKINYYETIQHPRLGWNHMARVQFNCWEWNLGFSEFTWRPREYPYNNKMDSQIKQLDNCQEEPKAWLMVHGFK